MANDSDNINVNIKAIVTGLENVRLLVREIEKLPGAGAGIKNLSKDFNAIKTEIQAAGNELRTVAADAQRGLNQVAAASNQVPAALNKTSRAASGVKSNLNDLSQGAAALAQAFRQALSGDVLGAIQNVDRALKTSLDFGKTADKAVTGAKEISKAVDDTGKVVTKFSGILGTAAKDAGGQLSGSLLRDFGIKAEQALLNPEIALQKFVSGLADIPDATERAIAVANVFGASTAALLPTLEDMVAAEVTASTAADTLAAAQLEVTAASEGVIAANAAEAVALAELNALEVSATATTGELAAAKYAYNVAVDLSVEAETAEALALTELTAAQAAAVATTVEVAVAEDVATASTLTLGAAVGALFLGIGAVVAIAGGIILAGVGIAKSFADAGTKMQDLSEKSGATVETLSALKLAAGESRVEFSKVESALPRFAKNLNEAAGGNKNLANTFKQLGVDVKAGVGNTDLALAQFLKKFQTIPQGAQQADAAFKAFGRTGTDLIPIFNRAGGSLDKFREEAAKLGGMTSEQAANAAKFNDAYEILTFTLGNLKNTIGAELLPTLIELIQSTTTFISNNKQGLTDLAGVIAIAFKVALGVFYALGGVIGFLTNLVYGLITVLYGLITTIFALVGATVKAAAALYELIAGNVTGAVEIMKGAVNDTKFALDDLVESFKRAGTIISQPTFTGLFSLLNGGDGSTSKTFQAPKAIPTGNFTGGGAGKKAKIDPEIKALADAQLAYKKAQIQAELDAVEDGLKHEKAFLDANFNQNLDSYDEYYKNLASIQQRSVQARIDAQQKLLEVEQNELAKAKKGSERVKAETEILKITEKIKELRHEQSDIEPLISVEVTKQARAYSDMINDIQEQLLEAKGNLGEAATTKIDRQFRDQLEKAQAKLDDGDQTAQADIDRINKLKDLLNLRAKYSEQEEKIANLTAERDLQETALNQQVERGVITRQQANDALAEFEATQTDKVKTLSAEMEKYANSIGDPKLQQAVAAIALGLEKWDIAKVNRQTDELKRQLGEAENQFNLENQRIDTAITNGAITTQEVYDQRQKAIDDYTAKTTALLDILQKIATVTANTDLQAYIDKAKGGLGELAANGDDLGKSLNDSFLGAFTDLFTSISDGTKSAGEAFADFGRQILQTLTQIAIKILITKLLLSSFGGGGSGGFGGFLSGLFGGDKAIGGHAAGGLISGAGTGTSDSNLRRLSNGEYVVNADATAKNLELLQGINAGINPQRNLNAGSGVSPANTIASAAAPGNMNIVNVLPNDLLANYVTTGDGRVALLNFIEDNAGGIKTRLGQ